MRQWFAKREAPLLILVTALVLALGFGLPDAVTRLQDAAMQGRTAEVPPLFPEEADSLPLVQAFWRRGYFYQGEGYPMGTAEEETDAPTVWLKQLWQAGAMTDELYQASLDALARQREAWDRQTAGESPTDGDGPARRSVGPLGFTRLSVFGCTVESWQDTAVGLVIYLPYGAALPAAPRVNCAALLDAYLAYCGLDELEDWQPFPLADLDQCQRLALYSPGTQLCALVQLDARFEGLCSFSLQVSWLSQDAADAYMS